MRVRPPLQRRADARRRDDRLRRSCKSSSRCRRRRASRWSRSASFTAESSCAFDGARLLLAVGMPQRGRRCSTLLTLLYARAGPQSGRQDAGELWRQAGRHAAHGAFPAWGLLGGMGAGQTWMDMTVVVAALASEGPKGQPQRTQAHRHNAGAGHEHDGYEHVGHAMRWSEKAGVSERQPSPHAVNGLSPAAVSAPMAGTPSSP